MLGRVGDRFSGNDHAYANAFRKSAQLGNREYSIPEFKSKYQWQHKALIVAGLAAVIIAAIIAPHITLAALTAILVIGGSGLVGGVAHPILFNDKKTINEILDKIGKGSQLTDDDYDTAIKAYKRGVENPKGMVAQNFLKQIFGTIENLSSAAKRTGQSVTTSMSKAFKLT